jgi:hypothetical protein
VHTLHWMAFCHQQDSLSQGETLAGAKKVVILRATGDLQFLDRKGLPTGAVLCDQSGMTKMRKNAAAVALGRLGGLKGGKARARKLTAAQRRASARKAARARWGANGRQKVLAYA